MNSAISNAISLCPEFNVTSMIQATFNQTTFPNPTEDLPWILCEYVRIYDYEQQQLTYSIWMWMYLAGTCLGIPGCILALITLDFNTVSFFYHRVINIFELFYIISMFLLFLNWYNNNLYSKSLFFMIYYCYVPSKLDRVFEITTHATVAWVGVERALLCNGSHWFEKVNRKSVAWAIVIGVFIGASIMIFPFFFVLTFHYNNATGLYNMTVTKFVSSNAFTITSRIITAYSYVEFIILILATILTIQGLIKMSRRKKKLITSAGFQAASSKNLMKQIVINKQLCLLQACETIPTTLLSAVHIFTTLIFPDMNYVDLSQMTLQEAERELAWQHAYNIVNLCGNMLIPLVHSTNFYRYFIFARKFRKVAILKLWRGNGSSGSNT